MERSLPALEETRAGLTRKLTRLGDFRRGSLHTSFRRCGRAACACAGEDHPGHGPQLRLSYKVNAKTVNETIVGPAARRKAEREIAAYREFQQLSRQLLEVNEQICRLRPVAEEVELSAQEKKRPKRSSKKSPKR